MNTAQLSMSIARTKAASTTAASTNQPARGPRTARRDAGDEERRHAELRERQRSRLPHGHEREQRRRREDDADAAPGIDQRGERHGVRGWPWLNATRGRSRSVAKPGRSHSATISPLGVRTIERCGGGRAAKRGRAACDRLRSAGRAARRLHERSGRSDSPKPPPKPRWPPKPPRVERMKTLEPSTGNPLAFAQNCSQRPSWREVLLDVRDVERRDVMPGRRRYDADRAQRFGAAEVADDRHDQVPGLEILHERERRLARQVAAGCGPRHRSTSSGRRRSETRRVLRARQSRRSFSS